MPHSKQAAKRLRQAEKLRVRRKSVRSEIKTLSKGIAEAVAREDGARARSLLRRAISRIDKAKKARVYHRNSADRQKSRLSRKVNTLGPAGTVASAP